MIDYDDLRRKAEVAQKLIENTDAASIQNSAGSGMSQIQWGHVVVDCLTEDSPMTLAVAFMGRDGWVLASDRRLYQTGWSLDLPTNQRISGAVTATTPKIHYDESTGIIYSFAGDGIAALAGELLVSKIQVNGSNNIGTLLNEVGNETFHKHIRQVVGVNNNIHRELLVLFLKKHPAELWVLPLQQSSIPARYTDKALIGDITNGAKLFWQLYYSPIQTVEQIQILAAYTILMGHECNESLVAGLEMWTSNANGGAQPVEQHDLESLVKSCSKIDHRIARLFGVKQLPRSLRL